MTAVSETSGREPPRPRLRSRIAPWAWAVLVLLLLQNVLGIYLNLYVALPESSDLLGLMALYGILAAHVVVGISLLVSTGILAFLAGRTHQKHLWIPAVTAFAFTFLAFESGIEFVVGGQDDVFSLLMEVFFLGVVASDVVVLYEATRQRHGIEAAATRLAPGE